MTRQVRPFDAAVVAAVALLAAAAPASSQQARDGAAMRALDVLDYDLTIDVPESGRVVRGDATLTVLRRADAPTLALDLVGLTVRSVEVNGRAVTPARTRETIGVPLPPRGTGEDTLRVRIVYEGEVADGLVAMQDERGRWTYFGDNWPNRARHWIPSVDHPSDKATVSWTVRAPTAQTVIANGALVERRPLAPRKDAPSVTVTRWRESRPIPAYLMVIAVAPLVERALDEGACGLAEVTRCVAQSVYVAPELASYAPGPFVEAPRIVEHFARLVGPFPYEKLAHLQSATRYGGMENASAIFYSDGMFERRAVPVGIIAHETAHQWFGDAVTEREWPHLWLSEGFATYFDALWVEQSRGDSAFRERRLALRREVMAAPVVAARPVIDTIETDLMKLLNANSYQKGGLVLHMLRREIGDSAFFSAVRAYYAAHRHGNALTNDLRAAAERAAGRPLDWFFDQWLRRPGWPELAVRWSHDAAARRVVLEVEQGSRFGAYRLPLRVRLQAGGVTQDTVVQVPASRTARVVIPVDAATRPSRVELDPGADLLAPIRVTP